MEAIWLVCNQMNHIMIPVAAFKSRKDADGQVKLLERNEPGFKFVVYPLTLTYNVEEAGYFSTLQEARDGIRAGS